MDFKLTLFNLSPSTDAKQLAADVMENYGEDFDAARGDFTSTATSYDRVEVIVKDAAEGDALALREDIFRDFGDEEDRMFVSVASSEDGSNWFPVDVEDN